MKQERKCPTLAAESKKNVRYFIAEYGRVVNMYRQIERMQGIGKTVMVDNVGSSREGYNIKKHSLLSFAESKGSAGEGGKQSSVGYEWCESNQVCVLRQQVDTDKTRRKGWSEPSLDVLNYTIPDVSRRRTTEKNRQSRWNRM